MPDAQNAIGDPEPEMKRRAAAARRRTAAAGRRQSWWSKGRSPSTLFRGFREGVAAPRLHKQIVAPDLAQFGGEPLRLRRARLGKARQ